MNKNCAAGGESVLDEEGRVHEVATQVLPRYIHDLQHLVVELGGKRRVQASQRLQYVRDAAVLQREQVLRSPNVAQIQPVVDEAD